MKKIIIGGVLVIVLISILDTIIKQILVKKRIYLENDVVKSIEKGVYFSKEKMNDDMKKFADTASTKTWITYYSKMDKNYIEYLEYEKQFGSKITLDPNIRHLIKKKLDSLNKVQ